MSTSALEIIAGSYEVLNVFLPGEPIPGPTAASAFRVLQRFTGGLGLQTQTYPSVAIDTFPIVANKETYTVGIGGDLSIPRPPSQAALNGISLVLNATAPEVTEIPYPLLTDDEYQALRIKSLSNTLFTGAWYNPTFPLGSLSLWPVPDNTVNSIRLYRKAQLPLFTSLTAAYDLPEGYDEMFVYNLARRLAGIEGRTMLPEDKQIAVNSLRLVKVSNTKLVSLEADPIVIQSDRRRWYNILTGE
jgi:hypothetical protein